MAQGVGASDDVATQALWRQVRAKLLAREGGAGCRRVGRGSSLDDGGNGLLGYADLAFENLGEVYACSDGVTMRSSALSRALDVCERKGAIAVADTLRAKVAALEAGS